MERSRFSDSCSLSKPVSVNDCSGGNNQQHPGDVTFISLICFPEVHDSDGFEAEVPEPHTAVTPPGSEALLAGIHAEDP